MTKTNCNAAEEASSSSDDPPDESEAGRQLAWLVSSALIGRTDGLSPPQLAAFVLGWQSALEIVARTDLSLPDADPDIRRAIERLVEAIERARAQVLDEVDEEAKDED